MNFISPKTFSPEVIYLFDPWNNDRNFSNMHSHDFLEISIILEGEAIYQFEGEEPISLAAGNVMIFNPGMRHREWQQPDTFSHQLHIGIRNISLDGFKRNFLPHDHPQPNLGKYQHFVLQKAWQAISEVEQQQSESAMMQKIIIIEMLIYILRALNTENDIKMSNLLSDNENRQQKIVNQVLYYIENHYDQEITLEMLAQDHFVSATYLSRIFKELIGISPISYLIDIRLNHAKYLLEKKQHTVGDVAKLVGYQDTFHFSKSFKKKFGKAPSLMLGDEGE